MKYFTMGYLGIVVIFILACGVLSLAGFIGAIVSFVKKKRLSVLCGWLWFASLNAYIFIKNILGFYMMQICMAVILLFDLILILCVWNRNKKWNKDFESKFAEFEERMKQDEQMRESAALEAPEQLEEMEIPEELKVPEDEYTGGFELLDGSKLLFVIPEEENFINAWDYGTFEIYQGFSYYAEGDESGKAKAEFYFSIAPELDCDLTYSSIKVAWETAYGRSDEFRMAKVRNSIFEYCAELRNEENYKRSYLLQMEEDLILECSMVLNYPGSESVLEEKLAAMFDAFAINCIIKKKETNQ